MIPIVQARDDGDNDDDTKETGDQDAADRRAAARRGHAMPDGSYPIRNETELRAAIRLVGRSKNYSPDRVKAHIIRRARALGLTSVLPDDWKVTQEEPRRELTATLLLEESGLPKPVIVQEPTPDTNGVMSIRVPFYVGGSLSKVPGFSKRVFFGEDKLPAIVQEGNRRIAEARPPLTTYARHAHALAANDLPIGGPRRLEQEGRIGYAVIDILDTDPHGRNAQKLMDQGFLNAVSLRSGLDFVLEAGKVNGESVLVCEDLDLHGIDLAPDRPAQDTYGVQILNEEISVERTPKRKAPPKRSEKLDQITLEMVRGEAPEIVQEIERPLREQITRLTQERDAVVAERDRLTTERDSYARQEEERKLHSFIAEIANRTVNPEAFREKFTAICQEQNLVTVAQATPLVTPLLLEALEAARNQQVVPKKTREEELRELFVQRPAGNGNASMEPAETRIVQERNGTGLFTETVGGLKVRD